MGGTFVGFNPANNTADGPNTNYVADGYKSTETTYNGKAAWVVTSLFAPCINAFLFLSLLS